MKRYSEIRILSSFNRSLRGVDIDFLTSKSEDIYIPLKNCNLRLATIALPTFKRDLITTETTETLFPLISNCDFFLKYFFFIENQILKIRF